MSAPAAADASLSLATRLARYVRLSPYSVLGSQLTTDRRMEMRAEHPPPSCLFVDPAGLPFIQELGPSLAAGAAGAIYDFLGIRSDETFPDDVRAHVTDTGRARWHTYTVETEGVAVTRNCCHVVGPNFAELYGPSPFPDEDGVVDDPDIDAQRREAEAHLTACYAAVLIEFRRSGLHHLRLLPISGGIFAGKFRGEIYGLTFRALARALRALDEDTAAAILRGGGGAAAAGASGGAAAATQAPPSGPLIEMCVFEEAQLGAFEQAMAAELGPLAAVAPAAPDPSAPAGGRGG